MISGDAGLEYAAHIYVSSAILSIKRTPAASANKKAERLF